MNRLLTINLKTFASKCSYFRNICSAPKDYKIQLLKPKYVQQAFYLMERVFTKEEFVSKTLKLYEHPEAVQELLDLPKEVLKESLSLVAVHQETDKVIAVNFNKIHIPNEGFFENHLESCRHPLARAWSQFLFDSDKKCDFFKICNVKAAFETLFACTHPEFSDRGVQHDLIASSLSLSKTLARGEDVFLENKVPNKIKPEIYSAVLTNKKFMNMAMKTLKMEIAGECGLEDFECLGKSFLNSAEAKTKRQYYVYLRLNKVPMT